MLTGLNQLYLTRSFFPQICAAQEAPDHSGLCLTSRAWLQIPTPEKILFMTSKGLEDWLPRWDLSPEVPIALVCPSAQRTPTETASGLWWVRWGWKGHEQVSCLQFTFYLKPPELYLCQCNSTCQVFFANRGGHGLQQQWVLSILLSRCWNTV